MNRLKSFIRELLSFLILAVPLFFTTITSEFFELPKLFLIYAAFLVCLLVLGLKYFFQKEFRIIKTPFDLPLILILVSLVLSTYFGANRIQAAMNGLAPLGIGILFYFVTTHLLSPFEDEDYASLTRMFILITTSLGFLSFLAYFNIHLFPYDFARNRFFTPVGSNISLIVMMALSAPISLAYLLRENVSFKSLWYHLSAANIVFLGLAIILQTSVLGFLVALPTLAMIFFADRGAVARRRTLLSSIGLAFLLVTVLFVVPLNFNTRFTDFRKSFPKPISLDARSSWVISIQTIRDYPIFGSGPGSFLSDFVRYRPAFLNYTPYWAQRFGQASGEPYQVLATTGLLGFLVFLVFFWKLLKSVFALSATSVAQSDGIAFSLLAFLIALLFSTPSPSLRAVFFILLALFTLKSSPVAQKSYALFPLVSPVVSLILVAAAGYLYYMLVLGEINFKRALNAAANNDAQTAINDLNSAVRYNPYRDNYHLSLASLAYTLANNLAAKPDQTDTDRQTLVQLVNASISEAKVAVSLDPFNGTNLETLSSIYHNISGAVENAAVWTVTAYQQAMQIDPTNPELRFRLGSLFYAAGNYETAGNYFAEAVRLKNDLPNYHYNLAWTMRNRNNLAMAIDEMTIVSRLVASESEDFKKALADLQEFQKLAQSAADQASQPPAPGQLELPQPQGNLAQPGSTKVNLPTEASPSNVQRK